MKYTLFLGALLSVSVVSFAQEQQTALPHDYQKQPAQMTPQMTEVWEPEVPVVKPGDQPGMAPSDAIFFSMEPM